MPMMRCRWILHLLCGVALALSALPGIPAHAADLVPPALVPEMPNDPPGAVATARQLDELAKDEDPAKDAR